MNHGHKNVSDTNLKRVCSFFLCLPSYQNLCALSCILGNIVLLESSEAVCVISPLISAVTSGHLFLKLHQLTLTFISLARAAPEAE